MRTYKLESLNPFDRHFFGKPLMHWANRAVRSGNSSKLELSSIDDFNKHYDIFAQAFRKPLVRMPETDVYQAAPVKKAIPRTLGESLNPLMYS